MSVDSNIDIFVLKLCLFKSTEQLIGLYKNTGPRCIGNLKNKQKREQKTGPSLQKFLLISCFQLSLYQNLAIARCFHLVFKDTR